MSQYDIRYILFQVFFSMAVLSLWTVATLFYILQRSILFFKHFLKLNVAF